MQIRIRRFALIASACVIAWSPEATTAGTSEPCTQITEKNYKITRPGQYCLSTDLHTRLSFADHSAEPWLIYIDAENVTLDLKGHVLGRGRFFRQPGGNGIQLGERARNVVIKTGDLRDFEVGIYRYLYRDIGDSRDVMVTPSPRDNGEVCIEDGNICLKDVRFSNVTHPFRIKGRLDVASPVEQLPKATKQ